MSRQELIAYLFDMHKGGKYFVRCKNNRCKKNEYKGYINVNSVMKPKVELGTEITLPCCQSKAMIKSVRFLPKNRKPPERVKKLK